MNLQDVSLYIILRFSELLRAANETPNCDSPLHVKIRRPSAKSQRWEASVSGFREPGKTWMSVVRRFLKVGKTSMLTIL